MSDRIFLSSYIKLHLILNARYSSINSPAVPEKVEKQTFIYTYKKNPNSECAADSPIKKIRFYDEISTFHHRVVFSAVPLRDSRAARRVAELRVTFPGQRGPCPGFSPLAGLR